MGRRAVACCAPRQIPHSQLPPSYATVGAVLGSGFSEEENVRGRGRSVGVSRVVVVSTRRLDELAQSAAAETSAGRSDHTTRRAVPRSRVDAREVDVDVTYLLTYLLTYLFVFDHCKLSRPSNIVAVRSRTSSDRRMIDSIEGGG